MTAGDIAGDVPVRDDALSRQAIAAELARRAARYGAAPDREAEPVLPVLVWSLGAERYAVPLGAVWAVAPAARLTAVPGAPAALIGIFARQGVIHNLFDPAPALGAAAGIAAGHAMLVLRQERPRIAIRVDAVEGIIEVPARELDDFGATRQIVIADGAVTLVDTETLIARLIGRAIPGEG